MLEWSVVSLPTDHVRVESGIPAYRPHWRVQRSGVWYPCLRIMLEGCVVSLPTGHIKITHGGGGGGGGGGGAAVQHWKRIFTESWLWEKNPSPHRQTCISSSQFTRRDALPTALHPCPTSSPPTTDLSGGVDLDLCGLGGGQLLCDLLGRGLGGLQGVQQGLILQQGAFGLVQQPAAHKLVYCLTLCDAAYSRRK